MLDFRKLFREVKNNPSPTILVKIFPNLGGLIIHPTDPLVLSSSKDGTIRVWRLDTFEQTFRLDIGEKIYDMKLTQTNHLYYHTLEDIKIWNFNQFHHLFTPIQSCVHKLSKITSPGMPTRILCAAEDGSVRLLSSVCGSVLTIIYPMATYQVLTDIVYDPRNDRIYIALATGEVLVFDTSSNPCCAYQLWVPNLPDEAILCITLMKMQCALGEAETSKGQTLVFAGHCNGQITLMESDTVVMKSPVQAHNGMVTMLDYSHGIYDNHATSVGGADRLLSIGTDKKAGVWEITVSGSKLTLTLLQSIFCDMCATHVSMIGNVMSLAFPNNRVSMYQIKDIEGNERTDENNNKRRTAVLLSHHKDEDHTQQITAICCCSRLRLFATTSCDGSIKIWDTDNQLVRELCLDHTVRGVCFANDRGDLLVGFQNHVSLQRSRLYGNQILKRRTSTLNLRRYRKSMKMRMNIGDVSMPMTGNIKTNNLFLQKRMNYTPGRVTLPGRLKPLQKKTEDEVVEEAPKEVVIPMVLMRISSLQWFPKDEELTQSNVVRILIELLDKVNQFQHRGVCKAVMDIHKELGLEDEEMNAVVQKLTQQLQHEKAMVRVNAVKTLGDLGLERKSIIFGLLPRLSDTTDDVRQEAINTITKLTGVRDKEGLQKLLIEIGAMKPIVNRDREVIQELAERMQLQLQQGSKRMADAYQSTCTKPDDAGTSLNDGVKTPSMLEIWVANTQPGLRPEDEDLAKDFSAEEVAEVVNDGFSPWEHAKQRQMSKPKLQKKPKFAEKPQTLAPIDSYSDMSATESQWQDLSMVNSTARMYQSIGRIQRRTVAVERHDGYMERMILKKEALAIEMKERLQRHRQKYDEMMKKRKQETSKFLPNKATLYASYRKIAQGMAQPRPTALENSKVLVRVLKELLQSTVLRITSASSTWMSSAK
uniref:Uncharacterized protein LOC100367647 n=1 Tax=Saccoglossus kowalevskii TaxID=10224 RepID=A0ABM0N010_SACKO|nr:PREDICTED: uncharacterized protein LOC100367647 [Saccoglossus kowalevskii]